MASGQSDMPDQRPDGSGAAQDGDAALHWNTVALDAIRALNVPPPDASRALAVESIAVYDAVAAVRHTAPFAVAMDTFGNVDADLVAAGAAAAALEALFPAQYAGFEADLVHNALASRTAFASESVDLGRRIGAGVAARYADDGWNKAVAAADLSTGPGVWRPTAPAYLPPLDQQWATLRPFCMEGSDAYRPAGPPALGSAAYRAAVQEVEELGSATSTTRTAEQTEIAKFWADGSGTYTPPGHWNAIAGQIAAQRGDGLFADAKMFATLNVALADAAIVAWDAKFHFDLWRPITAIREADPAWTPLLSTPPFPSYVSGHSTFSAAAAAVLDSVYGSDLSFDTTSLGLPDVVRHFNGFAAAAAEAGRSRIYGGIHFAFDDVDGQAVGREVAAVALKAFPGAATPADPVDGNAFVAEVHVNHVAFRQAQVSADAGGLVVAFGGTVVHAGHADQLDFIDGTLYLDPHSGAAQVHRLYQAGLGHAPDPAGMTHWTAALGHGALLKELAKGVLGSAEFSGHFPVAATADNGAFVDELYQNVLHRAPDAAGRAGWLQVLDANAQDRADVLLGFSESAENVQASRADLAGGLWATDQGAAQVARLYDTALGRAPDKDGLAYWTGELNCGRLTLQQEAEGFAGSPEFQTGHGALDDHGFVAFLYANALHRQGDAAGTAAWENALAHGASRYDVVLGFSESQEHAAGTTARIDGGIVFV